MSFLYFNRNSRLSFSCSSGNDAEESSGEDDVGTMRPDSLPPSLSQDDSSSFGLPSDASLSDPEVIIGFPPGTLTEIYRRQHEEQEDGSYGETILSSAPSDQDAMFPPRPEQQSQLTITWPTSPYPPLQVDSVMSISTTESEYRNRHSLQNSATSTGTEDTTGSSDMSYSALNLSSLPSSIVSILSDETGSCSNRAMVMHDGTAFRNVAGRLSLEQGNNGEWFSRFTEQDWKNFRMTAEMVIQALEPTPPPLVLPPSVPTFAVNNNEASTTDNGCYDLNDYLPDAFLCYLCRDAIVGATTLSCACDKSTVCTECWEAYSTRIVETDDSELVRIETRFTCPSCQGHVNSTVPCHALDVAIFHAVKRIPESLQHAYYARLDQWRKEVLLRRRLQGSSRQDTRHDLILAELIQQEEEVFWKTQNTNNRNNALVRSQQALLFIGEVAMCMAVASLSAVGITVLARRS